MYKKHHDVISSTIYVDLQSNNTQTSTGQTYTIRIIKLFGASVKGVQTNNVTACTYSAEATSHTGGAFSTPGSMYASGFIKDGSTSSKVLLGDGTDKNLSDFIGSLNWDSTNKKIQYKKIGDSSWTDLADISAAWTDQNVKQTSNSDNSDKNLALCTVSTSGNSAGLQYNANIKANPNTGVITAKGFKNSSSTDSNVLLGGGGTKPLNNMQVCGTTSAVTGANSMAALDISKTFIYATINANATLGVSANMTVGQVLTVLVDNTGSSAITITVPALANPVSTSSPNWYSLDGYSLTVPSGKKYEISILCFKVATSGSNIAPYYLVSAKSQ